MIGETPKQGDVSAIGEPKEEGDVSVIGKPVAQGDVSAIGEPAEHPSPETPKSQLYNTCITIFSFCKICYFAQNLCLSSLGPLGNRLFCQNEACENGCLLAVCGPFEFFGGPAKLLKKEL